MKQVALITGASSGIGREFARLHAQKGGDLIIVARRENALLELKQELESESGVLVKPIAMDLTDRSAPKALFEQITAEGIDVEYLINNAGFGGHGLFHEREWAKDQSMIQLNVTALTELCRLFLPAMVQRKSGRILNVASTAAFVPGPLQAVYYATKSYVLSLSQAVDEELRSIGANVTVTALCPGAVATEFVAASDLEGNDLWKNAKSPASVANVGYDAMLQGKLVVINERRLGFMLNWVLPWLPRRMVLATSRKSMEK